MTTKPAGTATAVVFAYHDIGVRCLETLIELGVDVRLVVTHVDNDT
jgi:methionyl-tRNA formyltransferase